MCGSSQLPAAPDILGSTHSTETSESQYGGKDWVLWLVSPVLSTVPNTKNSKPSSKQDNLGHQGPRPTQRTVGASQALCCLPPPPWWLGREGADRIRNPTGLGAFLPKSSQRTEDHSMKNIQDVMLCSFTVQEMVYRACVCWVSIYL